ncbi:uncharacterized protein LAJ45_00031 [Morchella importuna]|uniref:uncharacterized protein n=1 Tax=Morchella importuna TaxID=1174673 RepID=UPI001E8DBBFE|nr:uncharacterized protein LAJ45_00031 [Morchella importuna]KAH8155023.1 hypothetical protein LAJ45_00031 [Morchella importuna]
MHFKKKSSRLSFLSFPCSFRRQGALEEPAPPTPNPYIPTYAARSFTSSTTPVPLEQRYYTRQKKDDGTTRLEILQPDGRNNKSIPFTSKSFLYSETSCGFPTIPFSIAAFHVFLTSGPKVR